MSEPLQVEQDGRTWHRFACEYTTADGKFGFHIYAISHEHAVAMLEELKQTAVVLGQVTKIVPT
jgi:hypothetical protein